MPNTLRFLALLLAILFLLICWMWTYWVALVGYLFGGIAWGMLALAQRMERDMQVQPTAGWAGLQGIVRGLIALSVILSLISLAMFR